MIEAVLAVIVAAACACGVLVLNWALFSLTDWRHHTKKGGEQ